MQSGLAAVSLLGVELVGSAACRVVSRQGSGGCGCGRRVDRGLVRGPQPLHCDGGIIGAVTRCTSFSASHQAVCMQKYANTKSHMDRHCITEITTT